MSDAPAAVILVLMLFACTMAGVSITETANRDEIDYGEKVIAAIETCEAEIPRNQHCVAVINAKVNDDEMEGN